MNGRIILSREAAQALEKTIELGSQEKASKALRKSRTAVYLNIKTIEEKVQKSEADIDTEYVLFQR